MLNKKSSRHFRHSPGTIGAQLATAMEPCVVLSQTDVGELFGISYASVSRVEREALHKCFVRMKEAAARL